MDLIYRPDGEEAHRWPFNPSKMMSPEREWIEQKTGFTWPEFIQHAQTGHSLSLRALLFVMFRRTHPTIKWADLSYAFDELEIAYTATEYDAMIADTEAAPGIDDATRTQAVEALKAERARLYPTHGEPIPDDLEPDDSRAHDEGKAPALGGDDVTSSAQPSSLGSAPGSGDS
jgi:hypothetical protein